jgi:hypothetical protein
MAAVVVLTNLGDMLADAGSDNYTRARTAVEGAETVRDAVEGVGILNEHPDAVVGEARAVLDAIPTAADAAIMAALENAFERGVPVVLEWLRDDSATIQVRVSEEPYGDNVRVRIDFVSPHGATFV